MSRNKMYNRKKNVEVYVAPCIYAALCKEIDDD